MGENIDVDILFKIKCIYLSIYLSIYLFSLGQWTRTATIPNFAVCSVDLLPVHGTHAPTLSWLYCNACCITCSSACLSLLLVHVLTTLIAVI